MQLPSENESYFVIKLWQVVCSLISKKRMTALKKTSLIFVKVDRDNDKIKHKYMVYMVYKVNFFLGVGIGNLMKYLPRT